MDDMITLRVSRRDAGRLFVGVRERRHKLQRGLAKFRNNWDEAKGANMKEAEAAYVNLERQLKEQIYGENDRPRRAGRDPA